MEGWGSMEAQPRGISPTLHPAVFIVEGPSKEQNRDACVAQWVKCLPSAEVMQVMILGSGIKPCLKPMISSICFFLSTLPVSKQICQKNSSNSGKHKWLCLDQGDSRGRFQIICEGKTSQNSL